VLLDAVVEGLKRLPETRLEKLPRIADFALWATACETALWPAGTFYSAYCGNRADAVEAVIDADPIATAVRALMATRTVWTGTASDLLGALAEVVGERVAKSRSWPDGPRALGGALRRAVTFLRQVGIDIAFQKEKSRGRSRIITIGTIQPSAAPEGPGAEASAPSAPSVNPGKVGAGNDFSAQSARTQNRDADANPRRADGSGLGDDQTARTTHLENNAADASDGADANLPPNMGLKKTGAPGWSTRL
jgi:hypothetical protein